MVNRKVLWTSVASVAAVGLVAGISIVWPGLDAQQAPPVSNTVWVLQTADGQRYARVNTAIDELDTVRTVANPSSIAQNDKGAFLFSDTSSRLTTIDQAQPVNLDEDTLRASPATPTGTKEVVTAGNYVLYRTDGGEIYWGTLDQGTAQRIDPYAKEAEPTPTATDEDAAPEEREEVPEYEATIATINADGTVFAYSVVDQEVMRFSTREDKVLSTDALTDPGEAAQLTAVGDTWIMFDPTNQQVWTRGFEQSQSLEAVGTTYLTRPMLTGTKTYLADEAGLIEIPLDGTEVSRELGNGEDTIGTPARPTQYRGDVYGAWLDSGAGQLWTSDKGETTELSYNSVTLDDTRSPRFTGSDSGMVLNEARAGWVWTVPDGKLLLSSMNWSLDTPTESNAKESDVEAEVVTDPKPPIAVSDSFGVRPGGITGLPVLLNDHDPNRDVLTIDTASIQGLDPKFGTVALTDGGGRLAINVKADATGSASFSYRVTDGTAKDGLYSELATVTLTAVDSATNKAPAWCGVKDCLVQWPAPEVKPGGTVTTPVLNGWVDPDGDPMLVTGATVPSGVGAAAVTQAGEVVYQHPNPNEADSRVVDVVVEVSDVYGAKATKTLKVRVTPTPKITVQSFSLIDSVGADLTVDVAAHVLGTTGDMRLEDVRVVDDAPATVSLSGSGTAFTFMSKQAGVYRVSFSVTDGVSKAEGTARITLLEADAAAQLATSPVVAFVRPQEDSTIDVFTAVSNPTRRVLLLSGVEVLPETGASLQVDAVAQQYLRVTGTTLTGDPGRLGVVNYRVGDGSKAAEANVTGQATVYLLPPADDLAPIAVDDAVVVRANAQIDIPALANDVASSGAAILLDPSKIQSSSEEALAFASGSEVRYLAPSKPGDYTITYSIYTAGAPGKQDTATIKVTVIGDDNNTDPRPKTLEGRVLAGQSTLIKFDGYGVDPDGDTVTLSRILTQPDKGSAVIAPDGAGIVYTSIAGTRGQYSFTYRVTDSHGAAKTGTVRVGVLDEQSNPSPVTFTDYVQVQVGESNHVNVSPLLNDIDPTGGKLELVSVVPNLAEKREDGSTSPEFERWTSLIQTTNEQQVTIGAGTDPGTMSFLYNVKNEAGNTGRGLIVVKVVREAVPDYPVVTDTILTVETRDQFADGVDVLANKVNWSGGDTSSLKLSLWRDESGAKLSGNSISGDLPKRERIIPFAVTGVGADGVKVQTYAFLRIPGQDDKSISLRSGMITETVNEGESITFDAQPKVAFPAGETLEFDGGISPSGVRPKATCTISGSQVTYTAGEGAPWADSCTISVRLKGQDEWTILALPIRVVPKEPVPRLSPASLTINPGSTETLDLKSMVSWEGNPNWDKVVYSVGEPSSADFTLTSSGGTVSVTAADGAIAGRESSAAVNITSYDGVAPSTITLRVGAAPSELPKAGTTTKQCSTATGSSCAITVVGASGEVNPLPGTPLQLVSVSGGAGCTGVTFAATDASTVTASWNGDTPGVTCSVNFTLQDAQGRQTTADRQGTILFDLHGLPRAPGALVQDRYGDGTLGLVVSPGDAASSYPAIDGFTVSDGTTTVKCTVAGVCPDIPSTNGTKRTFTAVATNSVGASKGNAQGTAWAYRPPAAVGSISWVPTPNGNEGKLVTLSVSAIDAANASSLLVSAPGVDSKTVAISATETSKDISYNVGSNSSVQVSITPVSRFEVPTGTGPKETSGDAKTVNANGIGAPTDVDVALSYSVRSTNKADVTATASANANGAQATIQYGITASGGSCDTSQNQATRTFTSLNRDKIYSYEACATSVYNGQSFGTSTSPARTIAVPADDSPPTGYTYWVNTSPSVGGSSASYYLTYDQGLAPSGFTEEFQGYNSALFGVAPSIQVRHTSSTTGASTQWGAVTQASNTAPYQVQMSWSLAGCNASTSLSVPVSAESGGVVPNVSIDTSAIEYRTAGGVVIPDNDGDPLTPPPHTGAFTVSGVYATISWPNSSSLRMLDSVQTEALSKTCSG